MEGDRFSNSTLKYGIEIARQTDSLLVGVFMRDLKYAGYAYLINLLLIQGYIQNL